MDLESTEIRLRFDSDSIETRFRSDSDPTQVRLRFDSDAIQVRLRFDSDPTQIRFRFDSDSTQIRLRSDSDSTFDSDSTQIRFRFDPETVRIHGELRIGTTPVQKLPSRMQMCTTPEQIPYLWPRKGPDGPQSRNSGALIFVVSSSSNVTDCVRGVSCGRQAPAHIDKTQCARAIQAIRCRVNTIT